MLFIIGKLSNVDLGNNKIKFYDLALDKIGLILKDMSRLTNKEVVVMINIMTRLMNRDKNEIELDEDDMEFVKKYIGDIR